MDFSKKNIMIEMKPIEGCEGYYITTDGTVLTTKKSKRYNMDGKTRVLKPKIHKKGYYYVGLFVGSGSNAKRIWKRVHRIVIESFVGAIPSDREIDHIDSNKANNTLSNLRIVTRQENMRALVERRKQFKDKL